MNRMMSFISLLFILHVSAFCAQTPVDNPGTGTISGRVANAESQPIAGARVLLLKLTIRNGYDPNKTRTEISDSTGKYEFKNVQEGDYWVAVWPDVQSDPNGKISMFFFPETMSGKEAYTLRVGPNAVLTAIDVKCVPVKQGFEAKGRVLESVTRKPVTNMRLTYAQINSGFLRQDVQTDQNGSFLITRLDPGKYWVAISPEQSGNYYCYPAYFEITTSDVSDLQIAVYKGVSLKGVVVLGKGIPDTLFGDLSVSFLANGISGGNQNPASIPIDNNLAKVSSVSSDGSFVLRGLPPLIGDLSLRRRANLPLDNVVRFEQNGMNLGRSLRIRDKDIDGITIVVNAGTGKIRGKIKPVNTILDMSKIFAMISLQNEAAGSFVKKIAIDVNGDFEIDKLFPGEYRVMAVIQEKNLSRRIGDIYTVQLREGETKEIEIPINERF
jgi:hypothetical protein